MHQKISVVGTGNGGATALKKNAVTWCELILSKAFPFDNNCREGICGMCG